MKYTLLIVLVAAAIAAQGQLSGTISCPTEINRDPGFNFPGSRNLSGFKCGTWVKLPMVTGDWTTVDTLGSKVFTDTARTWVYDEERAVMDEGIVDCLFRPCGSGNSETYLQYRICSITGIRQKRIRYYPFKYIEPPVSEYDHIVDSLTPKTVAAGGDSIVFLGTAGSFKYDTVAFSVNAATPWKHFSDSVVGTKQPAKARPKHKKPKAQ